MRREFTAIVLATGSGKGRKLGFKAKNIVTAKQLAKWYNSRAGKPINLRSKIRNIVIIG